MPTAPTTTTTTAAPFDLTKVPAVGSLRDHPEWQAIASKLDELRSRQVSLLARRHSLTHQSRPADPKGAQVGRVFDDGPLPERISGPVFDEHEHAQQLTGVVKELAAVEAAIVEGEQRLNAMRYRVSQKVVAAYRDWHRALVVEQARVACQLHRLAAAELELFHALAEGDIAPGTLCPSGGPARPLFLGSIAWDGNVANWLRELVGEGFLTGKEPWLIDLDPPPPRSAGVQRKPESILEAARRVGRKVANAVSETAEQARKRMAEARAAAEAEGWSFSSK